jgi:hypothetical protein
MYGCAPRHLSHYLDPDGPRAFQVYDYQGKPDRLEPLDILAPGLLDAPVPGRLVVAMFAATSSGYTQLRDAIQAVLDNHKASTARFEEVNLESETGPWMLVRRTLQCSGSVPGFAASKVTKILHRKRPELVPIFDSKVAAFYGVTSRAPWRLWPILQADLIKHMGWLSKVAAAEGASHEGSVTELRLLDMIIWEHQTTGCTEGRG